MNRLQFPARLQFKVLYRQFLFRMVDLELLSASAQGDINTLLGRFAALLIVFSLWMSGVVGSVGIIPMPPDLKLIAVWAMEHFLIATTMLVVGLFAVISWDSMFPDRRDVLVLAPLPIRARTLFLAKVAAVGVALSCTVAALNAFTGFASVTLVSVPRVSAPAFDAAMAPVKAADMQAVLDRDLIPAMSGVGALAKPYAGVAIGVFEKGERRIFSYGAARPDSIFEIGSISKTFTGLILAHMVVDGKAHLDDPVRELLPAGTVAKPPGREITLLDLATHHSGLPPMPDNINPVGRPNRGADYHPPDLYRFLNTYGVAKPAGASFAYSNLGFAVLGQALADRAGMSYVELLRTAVTEPLGLHDTGLSHAYPQPAHADQKPARRMEGHDAYELRVQPIVWDALAPAGAIQSTAGDMLTYLEAQLRPEAYPALAQAIRESHQVHADATEGLRIALSWAQDKKQGSYWHDGATTGFTADVFFQPRGDFAAVVLYNHGPGVLGSFVPLLAEHIRQRFAGLPAISLADPMVPVKAGIGPALRLFGAYWFTMLAIGIFTFGFVLSIQGLAQLLPRQRYLRLSAFLQIATFFLFLSMYFLQLPFASAEDLTSPQNQELLPWLPSYWFLGMLQQLNGSRPEVLAVFTKRAWIGLAISLSGAAAAYLICYFRTLRKIAEQPDILPSRGGLRWLPRFGGSLPTAIVQFTIRTLARSRRHRVTLSFYLGIAFAIVLLSLKVPSAQPNITTPDPWHQVNGAMLGASFLVMGSAVVGIRVAFAMPLDLRANWIFRVVPIRSGPQSLVAVRRSLYALAVAPTWVVSAAVFLWMWPLRPAAGHLLLLGLIGIVLADGSLLNFRKIPFTCSYLPGKSHFHLAAFAYLAVALLLGNGTQFERQTLTEDPKSFLITVAILSGAVVLLRRNASARASSPGEALEFEDTPPPVIQRLGLNRDGTSAV